jgi:hypothetical protein
MVEILEKAILLTRVNFPLSDFGQACRLMKWFFYLLCSQGESQ